MDHKKTCFKSPSELGIHPLAKQMPEWTHHLSCKAVIRLRIFFLIPGSWKWNAWVRDFTAWLERKILE